MSQEDSLVSGMMKRGFAKRYEEFSKKIESAHYMDSDSIHGIGHTKRVLILCLALCAKEEITQEEELDILCLAAIYHDIGRLNDHTSPAHGALSVRKLKRLSLINPTMPLCDALCYIMFVSVLLRNPLTRKNALRFC